MGIGTPCDSGVLRMARMERRLASEADYVSPGGASEIRLLIQMPQGELTHAVCAAGRVSRTAELPELYEAYYVLGGHGEIWRKTSDGTEGITSLRPGRWVAMPAGTRFQYRAHVDTSLVFLVAVLPMWRPDLYKLAGDGRWADGSSRSLHPTPTRELVEDWLAGDLRFGDLSPRGMVAQSLPETHAGSFSACRVRAGGCSPSVRCQTVGGIWYVLGGHGELWCSKPSGGLNRSLLWPGTTVEVPHRSVFQFRSTGVEDLRLLWLMMPGSSIEDEIAVVEPDWLLDDGDRQVSLAVAATK